MTKPLKYILQSLNDSNYLAAKCILGKNERMRFECSLLKNGLKLREQLLKQWRKTSTSWATLCGDTPKNERKQMEYYNRISFLQNGEFQNSYQQIYEQQLVTSSASVVLKTICNNLANNFICEEDLFYGSETRFLLISEYFVEAESGLSKFYNLQRERKIWWMRFSADSSRYCVEPFDICTNKNAQDDISQKCKSITIKANFPFGFVNMESITLVPLYDINFLNSLHTEDCTNISLIRSVINLDLTTYDASDSRSLNRINPLMLNRKLAPYQILLASLNRENKTIDELTLHLEHVISKSGLRLYSTSIHTNSQIELEKNLMYIDNIGIPYALVVDDESCKSGLIKLRSRDTTLFETIHISDIPNYLLNILENSDTLILDASDSRSLNRIIPLMLNRKLAPYQILLASLNRENKTIDELTLHLEHVISKSGLRLYSTSIHTNSQIELEKNLMYIDNIGIPYALVVDDESCKSGLIKLRSRDTTLFETIHISDIPNYLLNILENSDSL